MKQRITEAQLKQYRVSRSMSFIHQHEAFTDLSLIPAPAYLLPLSGDITLAEHPGIPVDLDAHTAFLAKQSKLRGDDTVAVVFFGESASNHGFFHGWLNLAAERKLPVVFVRKNNQYALYHFLTQHHVGGARACVSHCALRTQPVTVGSCILIQNE